MEFNYGEKKENGQYERYPTLPEIEKVKVSPSRRTYIHKKCGVATKVSEEIAQTYTLNPKYYSHTFCVGCKNHLPVVEFEWEDGVTVGDVGTEPIYARPKMLSKNIQTQELYAYDSNDQMDRHIREMTSYGWTIGATSELRAMFLRVSKEY